MIRLLTPTHCNYAIYPLVLLFTVIQNICLNLTEHDSFTILYPHSCCVISRTCMLIFHNMWITHIAFGNMHGVTCTKRPGNLLYFYLVIFLFLQICVNVINSKGALHNLSSHPVHCRYMCGI